MPRMIPAERTRLMRRYGEAVREGRSVQNAIVPEMGSGHMMQRSSLLGVVFSTWDATFAADQEVRGSGNAEDITIVACNGAPLNWEFSDERSSVEIRDNQVCIYCGKGATEAMTYRAGERYRFSSARISLAKTARIVGRLSPNVDMDTFAKRLGQAPVILPSYSRTGIALTGVDEAVSEPSLAGLRCEGQSYDIIAACIADVLGAQLAATATPSIRISAEDAARLWDVRRAIEANPGHAPTCADLAATAHMSVSKFERDFKALFGTSVHAFIVERRLALACDLIDNTDLPMADIARTVGFAKPGHFSVAFRQRYGITPKQRRRH